MKLLARLLSGFSCGQSRSPTRTVFIRDVTQHMKNKNFLFIITLFLILLSCKNQQLTSSSVDGRFVGEGEDHSKLELILTSDNGFQYWERLGHGSKYTEGTWKVEGDLIILNSKSLSENETAIHSLSSAKWIVFEDSRWKIRRNKLTKEDGENPVLTKVKK